MEKTMKNLLLLVIVALSVHSALADGTYGIDTTAVCRQADDSANEAQREFLRKREEAKVAIHNREEKEKEALAAKDNAEKAEKRAHQSREEQRRVLSPDYRMDL